VEDVMYLSIVERFVSMGVSMLPPLDGLVDVVAAPNLRSLTDSVYSAEALDLVKEHLTAAMGPASQAFANTTIKVGKNQANNQANPNPNALTLTH
jgi:hypothetical protein